MRKIKQSDFYLSPVFQSLNLSNKNISEIAVEAVENAFEAKVQAVDLSRNQFIEFPLNLDKLIQFLDGIYFKDEMSEAWSKYKSIQKVKRGPKSCMGYSGSDPYNSFN